MNQFTLISLEKFLIAENHSKPLSSTNKDSSESLENFKELFHLKENSEAKRLSLHIEPLVFIQKICHRELTKSSKGYGPSFIARGGILSSNDDVKVLEDFFLILSNTRTPFEEALAQLLNKKHGNPCKALLYCSYILFFVGRHFPSDFEATKKSLTHALKALPCFAKILENKESQAVYNILFNPTIPLAVLQHLILIHSYLQTCRSAFLTFNPSAALQILSKSTNDEVIIKFNKSEVVMTLEGNLLCALKSLEKYLTEQPPGESDKWSEQFEKVSDFFFPPLSSNEITQSKKYTDQAQELAEQILPLGEFFLSHQITQKIGFLLICHCGGACDSKRLLTKLLKLLPELLTSACSTDTKKTLLLAFTHYYDTVLPGHFSKTQNELLALCQCLEKPSDDFEIVEKLCEHLVASDEKFVFEEVITLFNRIAKFPEENCKSALGLGVRLIRKCTSMGWKHHAYRFFLPSFQIMQRIGNNAVISGSLINLSEVFTALFSTQGNALKVFSPEEKFMCEKIVSLAAPLLRDPSLNGLAFLILSHSGALHQNSDALSEMMRGLPLLMTSNLPPKTKVAFLRMFYQQMISFYPTDPLKDEIKSLEEIGRLLMISGNVQDVLVGLCKFFSLSNEKRVVTNIFPLFDKLRELTQSTQPPKMYGEEMRSLGIRLMNRCISIGEAKAALEVFKIQRLNPKVTSSSATLIFNKIVDACFSSNAEAQPVMISKEYALQLHANCDYLFTNPYSLETYPDFVPIFQSLLVHNELERALSLLTTALAKKAPAALGTAGAQLRLTIADKFYKEGKFSNAFNLWKEAGADAKASMHLFLEWELLLFEKNLSKEQVKDLIKTLLNACVSLSGNDSEKYIKSVKKLLHHERQEKRLNFFEIIEFLQPYGLWLHENHKMHFCSSETPSTASMALNLLQQAGILTSTDTTIHWIASAEEVRNWMGACLFYTSIVRPETDALLAKEIVVTLKGIASSLLTSQNLDEKSFGLSLLCTCREVGWGKEDLELAFSALPSIFANDYKRRMLVWKQFLAAFDFSIFDLDANKILKLSEMLEVKNSSSHLILENFCKLFSSVDVSLVAEVIHAIWNDLGNPIGVSLEIALLSLVNHFEMTKKMLPKILSQKKIVLDLSQEVIQEALSQIRLAFPAEVKEKELRVLYELFVHSIQNKKQIPTLQMAEAVAWLISALFKNSIKDQKLLFSEGLFLLGLAERNKFFDKYPQIALELKNSICLENYPEGQVKSIYPLYAQLLDSCHADSIAERLIHCRANFPSVSPELFRLTLYACQKKNSSAHFEALLQGLIGDLKKGRNDSASILEIHTHLEDVLIGMQRFNMHNLFYALFEQLTLKSICLLPYVEKQNLYPLIHSALEENPADPILKVLISSLKLFKNANSLGPEGAGFYLELAEKYSSIPCLEAALSSSLESLKDEKHFKLIEKLFLKVVEKKAESLLPHDVLLLLQKIHGHFKGCYPSKLFSLWVTFLRNQTEDASYAFAATILIENAPWLNQQGEADQLSALATIHAKGLLGTQVNTSVDLSELYALKPLFWMNFFVMHGIHRNLFERGFNAFIRNPDNYSMHGGPALAHTWIAALRNCPLELQGTFPLMNAAYKEIVGCIHVLDNKNYVTEVHQLLLIHLFRVNRNSSLFEIEFDSRMKSIRDLCAYKNLQQERLFQMKCIDHFLNMEHPKALKVACKEIEGFYLSIKIASDLLTNFVNRALLQCSKLSGNHHEIVELLSGIVRSHSRLFPSSLEHKGKNALDLCSVLKFQQAKLNFSKNNLANFMEFLGKKLDQFEGEEKHFNGEERDQIKHSYNAIFELAPTEFSLSACRSLLAHPSYGKLWSPLEYANHSSKMLVNSFKLFELDEEQKSLEMLVRIFLSCRKYIKALGALNAVKKEVFETLIEYMFSLFTKYQSWNSYIEVYKLVVGSIGNASGPRIKSEWKETLSTSMESMHDTLDDLWARSNSVSKIERMRSCVEDFSFEFNLSENDYKNELLYSSFFELLIRQCIPNENTPKKDYLFYIINCYFFLCQNVGILDRKLMVSLVYKFMLHVYPNQRYINFRTAQLINTIRSFLILSLEDLTLTSSDDTYKLEILSGAIFGNRQLLSSIVLKDRHFIQVANELCQSRAAVNLHPLCCLLSYILTYSTFEAFIETFLITLKEFPKHSKFIVNEKIILKVKNKKDEDVFEGERNFETLLECLAKILILRLLGKDITYRKAEKMMEVIQEYLNVSIRITLQEFPHVAELNKAEKWEKTFLFYVKFLKATIKDPRLQNHQKKFLEMARSLIPLAAKVKRNVSEELLFLLSTLGNQKPSQEVEALYETCIKEYDVAVMSLNK